MKTKIFIVVLTLFISAELHSSGIKIDTFSFNLISIVDSYQKNNDIYIIGEFEDLPGRFSIPSIYKYDGAKWKEIPVEIKTEYIETQLLTNTRSQIKVDSKNNIWVSGWAIYKYMDGKWDMFTIEDEFQQDRKFLQFDIDKFDNLWITAVISSTDKQVYKSELYYFDGNDFRLIYETKSFYSFGKTGLFGKSLLSLPDGRVIVHRKWNTLEEEDYASSQTHPDLWIFDTDGNHQELKILTSAGEDYLDRNKRLTKIMMENERKIWFTTAMIQYLEYPQNPLCCSGLSYLNLEKLEWTAFYEDSGLPKFGENLYQPIYNILNLGEGHNIVFGGRRLFEINEDDYLEELSWPEILDNSTMIMFNPNFGKEWVDEKLINLYDTSETAAGPIINNAFVVNGNEIWMQTQHGIIVYKGFISSVIPDEEKSVSIYPNPATENLTIDTEIEFSDYRVVDLLGITLISGEFSENINVQNLSTGMYFLSLTKPNFEIINLEFIKK